MAGVRGPGKEPCGSSVAIAWSAEGLGGRAGEQRDRQGPAAGLRPQGSVLKATMSHRKGFGRNNVGRPKAHSPREMSFLPGSVFLCRQGWRRWAPGALPSQRLSKGDTQSLYLQGLLGAIVRGGTPERKGAGPGGGPSRPPHRPRDVQPPAHLQGSSGWRSAGPTGVPRAVHTRERVAVHPEVALSGMSWHPHQR